MRILRRLSPNMREAALRMLRGLRPGAAPPPRGGLRGEHRLLVLLAQTQDARFAPGEDVAHFRVFNLYKYIPPSTDEAADRWMQDRGVRLIIDRYAGTTDYVESRGRVKAGTLGSGEKITMIPSVLRINEATRHVWTIYALRPNSSQ